MTQAPAKNKEKQQTKRRDEDNIFMDMLYNVIVYIPVAIISWITSRFDDL